MTLKWGSADGTFWLKVPATTKTLALKHWLWEQAGEPAAFYFGPTTKDPVAWQWALPLPKFRHVWALNTPKADS